MSAITVSKLADLEEVLFEELELAKNAVSIYDEAADEYMIMYYTGKVNLLHNLLDVFNDMFVNELLEADEL